MQTIALEFKKLDKLPVPESANEILLVERADGMIRPIDVFDSMLTGKLAFNCHFSNELRYCHLKVTVKTEPEFKVGDFVEVAGLKGFHYSIFRIVDNQAWLIDTSGESRPIVPLTDLTLITE